MGKLPRQRLGVGGTRGAEQMTLEQLITQLSAIAKNTPPDSEVLIAFDCLDDRSDIQQIVKISCEGVDDVLLCTECLVNRSQNG